MATEAQETNRAKPVGGFSANVTQTDGAQKGDTPKAVTPAPTASQSGEPPPHLWLVPSGDTVLVYLLNAPATYRGFILYRRPVGTSGTGEKLHAEPIKPIRDPSLAVAMLGDDRASVAIAVRAENDEEIARRLRADVFVGDVLGLVYRRAARVMGTFYADTTVTRGASYVYELAFVDPVGRPTTQRVSAEVRVVDAPIAVPTELKTAIDNDEVALRWSFPTFRPGTTDFVIGFHVYRAEGTSDTFRQLTTTPIVRAGAASLRYTDTDAVVGTNYRYQLRAVDVAGRLSAPTATVNVAFTDHAPPVPPADLATVPGDGAVLVTWRMAIEVDAAGYFIERAPSLDKPFVRLNTTQIPLREPSYADSSVQGGVQYFYRVVAIDANGNQSAPSNALSAVPEDNTAPLPPSGLKASVHNRRLEISWNASPSKDVRGYYIYRGDHGIANPVRITPQPITEATTFADSGFAHGKGLTPGSRYVVRVSAIDLSYNESVPIDLVVVVPDDEAPAEPTALAVRNIDGRSVLVTWNSSTANDVKEYVLLRSQGATSSAGAAGAAIEVGRFSNVMSYSDTAVTIGVGYLYQLIAIDSAGNKSPAVTDTVYVRGFTPPPPPRYAAVKLNSAGGIDIQWERVVAEQLVGYHVYRLPSPTAVGVRVTTEPVTSLTFTDRAGTGTAYYVIKAIDRSGNESRPSPAARVE